MILIPGIVSSGLESWSTKPEAAPFFRKRIWASTAMLRAILTSKDTWVAAMSLDPDTGIDQEGYKVRAAQGGYFGASRRSAAASLSAFGSCRTRCGKLIHARVLDLAEGHRK